MAEKKSQKAIIYPEVKVRDVWNCFWQGISPQKWLLFSMLIFVVLANILVIITPLLYKKFFDILAQDGEKSAIAFQLVIIISQIGILNFVRWAFYRVLVFLNASFQTGTIARLKQQSYDYMMHHSYSFFANSFAGSLVQRVNRFARAFETLSDRIIWDVLPTFVRIVFIILVVYLINPWISLMIFLWIAIFLFLNILFSSWKIKYDILVAEVDSKTTAYLADTIGNQNTIQLFNGYNLESRGYKAITDKQAKTTKMSWNLDAITESVQSFLGLLAQFLLFYFAIKYWQVGLVSIGFFVLLQVYIINLIDQLWDFSRIIRVAYQSYADAKEMVEIRLLSHEITDKPSAKELNVKKGKIEFKNLKFAFNETRKVLDNINLVINPGEKVALIGPSGAGKTTFIRLLLRLYSPTSGQVLIDGQDISDVTQGSLRQNISLVPQDPILFHRTLSENISYARPDAKMPEIEEAAKSAHCEFIDNLPYKFSTFVGERGIKLSGGERQRVAIARAVLKNAPILILDEATSSLDSNSEMLIQDALNNLMKDKTTIVIAHRLSTIQKMDRIIVVDQGKIIEQGSHQELLSNENSLYKKLWDLQAGGFIKSEDDEDADEDLEDDEENVDIANYH